MKIAIVVGNPQPKSRTLTLAVAVADAIAATVGETSRAIIDLADVSGEIFDFENKKVAALNDEVASSDFVIFATPTYKASYTGLLKAFLDRYPTHGLAKVVAIPVMTGGSPAHSLAPDMTLRPLLVELAASVPTRSLYFIMSQVAEQAEIVKAWADANSSALAGAAGARKTA